ncbi:MAG: hypothetical protein ABI986_10185, partial [Chloroflexota bacterium]
RHRSGQRLVVDTAQIDGPSSDIYIYNLQDKSIRRLTDEPENIYSVNWAPNGQGILYEISSPLGNESEGRQFHLVNLEGKEIRFTEELLYEYLHWDRYDWVSENFYLILRFNDVEPNSSDLKILNTDTGQVQDVWPDTADSFAVNKENKTIVVLHKNYSYLKSTIAEGIYMVHLNGKSVKISNAGYFLALMEGQKPYPIFAQDSNRQFYSISNDGSMNLLPWATDRAPWISPDGKLLLYLEYKKIDLYTDSYQLAKSWQIEDNAYGVTWSPDSSGLFIFTDINAYYLSIPDGEPRPLLDNCSPKQCAVPRFVWLP